MVAKQPTARRIAVRQTARTSRLVARTLPVARTLLDARKPNKCCDE